MGYSTVFKGQLKFKNELTGSQLARLNKFLGKDRRDIGFEGDSVYEGGPFGSYWYHIGFRLTDDFSGIEWNESEKTYDLDGIANWLTMKMREYFPEFELTGELIAQGEDYDDRWKLKMVDGVAKHVDWPKIGQKITCPHCEEDFTLEEND